MPAGKKSAKRATQGRAAATQDLLEELRHARSVTTASQNVGATQVDDDDLPSDVSVSTESATPPRPSAVKGRGSVGSAPAGKTVAVGGGGGVAATPQGAVVVSGTPKKGASPKASPAAGGSGGRAPRPPREARASATLQRLRGEVPAACVAEFYTLQRAGVAETPVMPFDGRRFAALVTWYAKKLAAPAA